MENSEKRVDSGVKSYSRYYIASNRDRSHVMGKPTAIDDNIDDIRYGTISESEFNNGLAYKMANKVKAHSEISGLGSNHPGEGITVAIIDSGLDSHDFIKNTPYNRVVQYIDLNYIAPYTIVAVHFNVKDGDPYYTSWDWQEELQGGIEGS